jgi:hypothetical protein
VLSTVARVLDPPALRYLSASANQEESVVVFIFSIDHSRRDGGRRFSTQRMGPGICESRLCLPVQIFDSVPGRRRTSTGPRGSRAGRSSAASQSTDSRAISRQK